MFRTLILLCLFGLMIIPSIAADPLKSESVGVPVVSFPRISPVEEKIRRALEERTEVAFTDTPLVDALDFLRDLHQFSIIVDVAALQGEGVDSSSPVNLELSGITLRSAMRIMLRPLQLTYVIEDEVMKITTEAKANESLATRVYPVPDLATDGEELESIVDAIQAGCGTNRWEAKLGLTITGVTKSRSLVIRQTQAMHEEIEALLKNLRDAEAQLKTIPQFPKSSVPVY